MHEYGFEPAPGLQADMADIGKGEQPRLQLKSSPTFGLMPGHLSMVKMDWTKSNIEKLLLLYYERPCLWKIKDEQYTNKKVKSRMYNEIVQAFKSDYPDIDQSFIKSKIQNLRSSYRKEVKKVEASLKNESGEIYEPALWYFNMLDFTRDQERPQLNNSNVNFDVDSYMEVGIDETKNSADQSGSEKNEEDEQYYQLPHKKLKLEPETEITPFMTPCTTVLDTPPVHAEDCVAFGNYVAQKLYKMDDNQQILAEALIQKIITKGMRNHLTDDTDLVEKRSKPDLHATIRTQQYD